MLPRIKTRASGAAMGKKLRAKSVMGGANEKAGAL
jgi:hypothetical protein